jgi:hypothetical protein
VPETEYGGALRADAVDSLCGTRPLRVGSMPVWETDHGSEVEVSSAEAESGCWLVGL